MSYPKVLTAESKDPDQIIGVCRLICVFAVHICLKTLFFFFLPQPRYYFGDKIIFILFLHTNKRQSQLLPSALSSACSFKSHFCKQCGPRSDCSFRSSLIRVHTVCLYAKIGLKSLQEYSADDINGRHFQMHVFLAL